MIPYVGKEIFSLQDVQKHYPKIFRLADLKNKKVLNFQKEELDKLKQYWGSYKTISELKEIATARGYYDFLWVIDNATTAACSWGWQASDTHILLDRMKNASIDPWQISNVVGDFISELQGHGYVEITRPDGSNFLVYDPAGKKKPRKIKETSIVTFEDDDEGDRSLEVPDDDYDDYGATPGQLEF